MRTETWTKLRSDVPAFPVCWRRNHLDCDHIPEGDSVDALSILDGWNSVVDAISSADLETDGTILESILAEAIERWESDGATSAWDIGARAATLAAFGD